MGVLQRIGVIVYSVWKDVSKIDLTSPGPSLWEAGRSVVKTDEFDSKLQELKKHPANNETETAEGIPIRERRPSTCKPVKNDAGCVYDESAISYLSEGASAVKKRRLDDSDGSPTVIAKKTVSFALVLEQFEPCLPEQPPENESVTEFRNHLWKLNSARVLATPLKKRGLLKVKDGPSVMFVSDENVGTLKVDCNKMTCRKSTYVKGSDDRIELVGGSRKRPREGRQEDIQQDINGTEPAKNIYAGHGLTPQTIKRLSSMFVSGANQN